MRSARKEMKKKIGTKTTSRQEIKHQLRLFAETMVKFTDARTHTQVKQKSLETKPTFNLIKQMEATVKSMALPRYIHTVH